MKRSFFGNIAYMFTKIDLFPKKSEILFLGEEANKTFLGAIATLSCIIFSLYLTSITFKDYILERNPLVFQYFNYDVKSIPINYETFFLSIGFYSYLENTSSKLSNYTNNYTDLLNISDIRMACISCDFNINQTYYQEYYQDLFDKQDGVSNRLSNRNLEEDSSNEKWTKAASYLTKSIIEKRLENYNQNTINNKNFFMTSCEKDYFKDNVHINTLSNNRTSDVLEILKTYSYCFPKVFESEINDGSNSWFDQTLIASIDYQKVNYIPEELKNMFTVDGAVDPSTGK